MKKFKIEYKNPKDLRPYKLNAKTHPQSQVDLIKHSIHTIDFDQPIVIDDKNEVIKGHGRLLSSIELNLDLVPVIIRNDLTEIEKRAARLADNRSAESPLDLDILKLELSELNLEMDLNDIGFNLDDLEEKEVLPPDDFKEYDENIETQHKCPKCGYEWD